MTDKAAGVGPVLSEGLGPLPYVADAASVLMWAQEKPRRPANTAFTAGPERQAAYWIEWAEAAERERCASIVEREVLIACPHLRESEFAALIRRGA